MGGRRREGGRKRREEDVGRRSEEATGWIRERRERGESREEIGGRQEEGGGKSCNMFKLLNLKQKWFCLAQGTVLWHGRAKPVKGGVKRRPVRRRREAPLRPTDRRSPAALAALGASIYIYIYI